MANSGVTFEYSDGIYLSITLNASLSHIRSSPIMAAHMYIFVNVITSHAEFHSYIAMFCFLPLPCFVSYHTYVTGKLRVLKFCTHAKFTKLKLIEYLALATLLPAKYCRSTVLRYT